MLFLSQQTWFWEFFSGEINLTSLYISRRSNLFKGCWKGKKFKYSLYTQVKRVVKIRVFWFSSIFNIYKMFFEKGSNGQYNFCSDSHHPIKKFPKQNLLSPNRGEFPLPLNAILEALYLLSTYYLLPAYLWSNGLVVKELDSQCWFSKVELAFHPSRFDQMSAKNFCKLSNKK